MEGELRAHARPRARADRPPSQARVGNGAAPAPDRRARRDAGRADRPARGRSGERERRRQRAPRAARGAHGRGGRLRGGGRPGRGLGRGGGRRSRRAGGGPGRGQALPLPPPHGLREDDRRCRLRRGGEDHGRAHPHAPAPAREPVHERPDDGGLRRPLSRRGAARPRAAPREPDHDPDVRVVRAARRLPLAQGLPAGHLRRGPHGARGKDERRHPEPDRADLHRHDGDRAADRQAGLGRLPCLGRRPAARRRRAPRADRAPALAQGETGGRDLVRADRGRGLRPGDPGQGPRPGDLQPGRRKPLPRPLRRDAGDRVRGRRRARVQPGAGVPRGRPQGRGRERADAAREACRDARRLRARRDQHPRQRPAARRRLELTQGDDLHAPRPDGEPPRLPAAHRPHHAPRAAQGGGRRRGLRRRRGHAQRPHDHDSQPARLGLLPARRTGHAGAAATRPAAREAQALARALARAGDAGCAPPRGGHHARMGARGPRPPCGRRTASVGPNSRPPGALRGAPGLRREARPRQQGVPRGLPR